MKLMGITASVSLGDRETTPATNVIDNDCLVHSLSYQISVISILSDNNNVSCCVIKQLLLAFHRGKTYISKGINSV